MMLGKIVPSIIPHDPSATSTSIIDADGQHLVAGCWERDGE